MATEFLGESPLSLTVAASPTPTTTTCTVSSATDLVVGQYVNIEVSGSFERTKITSISTNALTFDAISGAPDVPGEVRSTRSLIKTSTENAKGVYNADDVTDLKTVDTTYAPDGLKYTTLDSGKIWRFDSGSAATADDVYYVNPTTGPGQWVWMYDTEADTADSFAYLAPVGEGRIATFHGKSTIAWTSISNGANQSKTMTVVGAIPGVDIARAHCTGGLTSGVSIEQVYVSAVDQVTIVLRNESGGADTPSNTDYWIAVVERWSD